MPRLDLLTAQMCQRTAKRLSIQSDEKMQFFGANGQFLGFGAVLSRQTIHEFLLPITPIPFDGVPVSFPYTGRDGEFRISGGPHCRGFEVTALSFATAQPQSLQSTTAPLVIPPKSISAIPALPYGRAQYYSGIPKPLEGSVGQDPAAELQGEDTLENQRLDDSDYNCPGGRGRVHCNSSASPCHLEDP